jgi:hypothetical protein
MGQFQYQVVKRQHGWAYHLEETYSRVFTMSWEAITAAKATARSMHEPGDRTSVRVQDGPLNWRTVLVINGTSALHPLDAGLSSDAIDLSSRASRP